MLKVFNTFVFIVFNGPIRSEFIYYRCCCSCFFTLHICTISFIVIYVFRLFYGCIFQQHVKNTGKKNKKSLDQRDIYNTHACTICCNLTTNFSQINLHGNLTACLNDGYSERPTSCFFGCYFGKWISSQHQTDGVEIITNVVCESQFPF